MRVGAIVNTKAPVPRHTPSLCDRDDANDISVDAEDQPIWKSFQGDSTVISIEPLATDGRSAKHCYDTLHLE